MAKELIPFITDYLQRKHPFPDGIDIATYRYLDSGHVDSLGLMAFVAAIEDKFDVEISEQDMLSEEFKCVGGVCQLIKSKLMKII